MLIVSATAAAETGRAIPPGQEELLAEMLGRGASLPGDCRFAGGGVEATVVVAQYTCGGDAVVVELRHPGDAPAEALRTRQFAVVVRSGQAPSELPPALAASIRAREADLEWTEVSVLRRDAFGLRLGAASLASCAAIIVLLTFFIQHLVATRIAGAPPAPPASIPPFRRGKRARGIGLLLIATFLLTRTLFLTRLPAYIDESVHLQWARSLLDAYFIAEFSVGRWLPVRIMALFVLLPIDVLAAARLASVAMGLAVLVGCVRINHELFADTEGLLAGAAYVLLPYALLYDRMALADIDLVAFGTWAVYLSIVAARRPRPATSLGLSLCIFGAILSKPTGGVFLVVPLLASWLVGVPGERGAFLRRVWPALAGGAALLSFLLWAGYGTGLLQSQVAVEGRGQLGGVLLPNLAEAWRWFSALLTPPVAVAALAATAAMSIAGIAGGRADTFLVVLLAVSVLPSASVSRTWYPSYLLFAVVPIALLLGRATAVAAAAAARVAAAVSVQLREPTRRAGCVVAVLLLLYATAPLDVALIARPHAAALPPIERSRYVSGALSGYGLPELSEFLRAQARAAPINVLRFDLVQPPKDGLDVYLSPGEAIHLYSIDHRDDRAAARIAAFAEQRRTLFVSNPEVESSLGISLEAVVGKAERIWSHARPGGRTRLEVWALDRGD